MARHLTIDATADAKAWPSPNDLELWLIAAAKWGGATPLEVQVIKLPYAPLSRPGSPEGGTAWCGLDESHITLHWYDEGDEVRFALDVFTCGVHANPDRIVLELIRRLGTKEIIESKQWERFRNELD